MEGQKRRVFDVEFVQPYWVIKERGSSVMTARSSQKAAVEYAATHAKQLHKEGALTQVVIHGKDGRIKSERTYGRDPERTKG